MKPLSLFLWAFALLLSFTSCDTQETDMISNEISTQAKMANSSVEKPLKLNFFTKRNYSLTGEGYCTEAPFVGFNYQVGAGTGTHLGNFSVTIKFCEAGLTYTNIDGVLIAANGDELYFTNPDDGSYGEVIIIDDPFYEGYFEDPIVFNGGTGRFEGATGNATFNSYVNSFDDDGNFIPEFQTDHQLTGTLILPKGNK
ncbi:hypothetical protein [Mangrovimonas sp. DI 80]|uniref:hypothetical protein n=1 Tax=Mangrovimonas sp. DI 80 TaxID=1779330 RepID=UPI000975C150|nr:hypothetical protein [Mangrovimonas sp. DI 80]OMP32638.1 hypothetical protein BKM32_06245 [Mangrovimonas sp. DI 80]